MITDFLSKLNQLDIKLWVEDDRLRYSAPEGVLTDVLKAELIQKKAEIIRFLQQAGNTGPETVTQILRIPRQGKLALSYAQKWLWLYEQVESNSFAFNIPMVVRLKGKLNIPTLESSINEIIRRHEVLRTVFVTEGNDVFQEILPELTITLPVENLQDLSGPEQDQRVYGHFTAQAQQSFNLEKGPLLRLLLLKLKKNEFALVLTLHHSISDNWSLNIFIRELAACYKAALNQETSGLPELTVQYADYAAWQLKFLKSSALDPKLAYWKERLKNIDAVPVFPTDFPRPETPSRQSIRRFEILPEELVRQLKTLSQKEGCSLYVTLLAAYKILLHQYSGIKDIIVGSPVAGRTQKELEGLIGFFINTVVLRTQMNQELSFREWLKEIRKTATAAIANQEVPFELLVQELDPKRERGRTPFFQVFFNMYSSAFELELPQVKITPFSADMIGAQNVNSKFDMILLAIEHQTGLQIDLSLNADLFAETTGTWLFEHFKRLLDSAAENPDRPLSEFPPLLPKDHRLIEPANSYIPIRRDEVDQLLHVRFEQMAREVPQNIAVEGNNQTLTYGELNKQANRLGRFIINNMEHWPRLTKKERLRYTRQLTLNGWGIESQEVLKKTTVFAAGAGGSGSPTIMQLALLGVGTIIVCDFDNVELSNLNRQVLHDESRLGMNKAESAALTIQKINPHVKVIVRTEKISRDNVFELVADSAIIFDNVDDLEAKFVLSECAVAKGIPHVISSMIERSPYAAVLHTPHTPCFHCLYDRQKLDLVRELRSDQSWKKVANPVASPALFTAAGFACNEALKILLGLENCAYNKYFFFNQQASPALAQTTGYKIVTFPFSDHFRNLCKEQGFDWEQGWNGQFIQELTLEKDPDCPLCGAKGSVSLPQPALTEIAATPEQPLAEDSHQETVALFLGHEPEMIIGMLGVLKSGNIFAPMDPTYPEERLQYMLEDTGARLIITDDPHQEKAVKLRDKTNRHLKILNINQIGSGVSVENLPERVKPDSLAYITYTSGSTGYPKGVMQQHRNTFHFIMNYTNGLHISREDRLSLIPSFSFSAAMMDTFGALLNGAALCLYNIQEDGPAKLGQWLNSKHITIYHSVPTVFRHFVATITENMSFPDLRLIDFGGEPVSSLDVEQYKKHFGDQCLLVNGLGATELNVIRQYYIDKQTEIQGNTVPVGYPVSDTEILLMDEDGAPVQYNRPGEIVIKSEFLSPGYWEMPEQTGLVFQSETGSPKRLYHTGDLGRLRTDGCLEHLGRKDSQLKIRGIRIEASEIETVLLEIAAVKEVVALAEANARGDNQLVAYLVGRPGQTIDMKEIYEHIQARLPEYMVPSHFIQLPKLPLTPNGKVDRKALPKSDGTLQTTVQYEAPRNEMEAKLLEIWKNVFGIAKAGIHDSFYDLGGHSLIALQICDQTQQLGLDISVHDILTYKTIAKICANMNHGITTGGASEYSGGGADLSGGGKEPRRYEIDIPETKILPLKFQNEITSYLHYILPLTVVLTDERLAPWYYEHFINIFTCMGNWNMLRFDFLEYEFIRNQFLTSIQFNYELLFDVPEIIPFLLDKINRGYYAIIWIDEYYIAEMEPYQKRHFLRPTLIYGYHHPDRRLLALGFNQQQLFGKLALDYDQFVEAFESGKARYPELAPWAEKEALELLRFKNHATEYPFDLTRFLGRLDDYLAARGDNSVIYHYGLTDENVAYGVAVYDEVIGHLKNMATQKFTLNYVGFHFLAEHKKGIYNRLRYIGSRYQVPGDLLKMIDEYDSIVEQFEAIRIKCMEFRFEIDSARAAILAKAVSEVIEQIITTQAKERPLLSEISRRLKLLSAAKKENRERNS